MRMIFAVPFRFIAWALGGAALGLVLLDVVTVVSVFVPR